MLIREFLLRAYRNTPLRVTVHVLEEVELLDSQAGQSDATLPACVGLDRIRERTDDKTSSGESRVSEEVGPRGVPRLRSDLPSISTRDLSMVSNARREPTQEA